MRTASAKRPIAAVVFLASLFLSSISCQQYDYGSPLPGVLEVRLAVKNNRTDLIPFGQLNIFLLKLTSLEVREPEGTRLAILSDLQAIRRNPDGHFFNCLDTLARDSAFVLGMTYAPPKTFTKLNVIAEPVGAGGEPTPYMVLTSGPIQ
ncbi:MAG: hypothetical protein HY708_01840, partial [Ignavibacteriae bacterium]|nr:hypothetical protein [Ignavibacteriota bacterium]